MGTGMGERVDSKELTRGCGKLRRPTHWVRHPGKQALRLARSWSLWYKAFGGDPHTPSSGDDVPGHSWNEGYLFLVFLLVLVGGFPFALQRDFCWSFLADLLLSHQQSISFKGKVQGAWVAQ